MITRSKTAAGAVVSSIVLVLVLPIGLGAWKQLESYDVALAVLINSRLHTTALDALMDFVSDGRNGVALAAGLVMYRIATARRSVGLWVQAGLMLLVIATADGSATALKRFVGRPRPCQTVATVQPRCAAGSASFPSNHAANMFALAALLATYDPKQAPVWFTVAALVAYSRVYLGAHYPADVLAGAALGVLIGLAAGTGATFAYAGVHRTNVKDPSADV